MIEHTHTHNIISSYICGCSLTSQHQRKPSAGFGIGQRVDVIVNLAKAILLGTWVECWLRIVNSIKFNWGWSGFYE